MNVQVTVPKFNLGNYVQYLGATGMVPGTIVDVFTQDNYNTYNVLDSNGHIRRIDEPSLDLVINIQFVIPENQEDDHEDEEYHDCGVCTKDWECGCNRGDVDINHNFGSDIEEAIRLSSLE